MFELCWWDVTFAMLLDVIEEAHREFCDHFNRRHLWSGDVQQALNVYVSYIEMSDGEHA